MAVTGFGGFTIVHSHASEGTMASVPRWPLIIVAEQHIPELDSRNIMLGLNGSLEGIPQKDEVCKANRDNTLVCEGLSIIHYPLIKQMLIKSNTQCNLLIQSAGSTLIRRALYLDVHKEEITAEVGLPKRDSRIGLITADSFFLHWIPVIRGLIKATDIQYHVAALRTAAEVCLEDEILSRDIRICFRHLVRRHDSQAIQKDVFEHAGLIDMEVNMQPSPLI